MKELTVEDQIYLCKYHNVDDNLSLNLRITKKQASDLIEKFKSNGLYEQYRNLSDEDYEAIIKKEKRKNKFKREDKKIMDNIDIVDLENGYVKVPLKTVMDWCYDKGRLDQLLENKEKEG